MSARGLLRTALAAAGLAAIALVGFVLAHRARPELPAIETGSFDPARTESRSPPAEAEPAPVRIASRADAAAADLRASSPTFRNSSLLVAIRRAGFYCDEVASAEESADGVWVASCADRGGYALSVRDSNQFDVRPIAHYFDSVAPAFPIRGDRLDRDRPLEPLEQTPPR